MTRWANFSPVSSLVRHSDSMTRAAKVAAGVGTSAPEPEEITFAPADSKSAGNSPSAAS